MKQFLSVLVLGTLSMANVPASAQMIPATLDNLRDQKRVLLVFSNGDNRLADAQLAVAAEHAADFRERDLVLVGITGTNPALPTAVLSTSGDKAARSRFHVQQGQFTVLLLGKDGGEKMRSRKPISWEALQSTIDAMPMRQDEMRRR